MTLKYVRSLRQQYVQCKSLVWRPGCVLSPVWTTKSTARFPGYALHLLHPTAFRSEEAGTIIALSTTELSSFPALSGSSEACPRPLFITNSPNSRSQSPIGRCLVSLPSFAGLLPSIGLPSVRPLSLLRVPSETSGATPHMKRITQVRRKKQTNVRVQGESYRHETTIDTLPDDVLLEIFAFYHGDKLSLNRHTVSISEFSAHSGLQSGRISISGQPFLLSRIIALAPLDTTMKTMSLPHLSTPIECVISSSAQRVRSWERWPR
ncbi:hypothetical protein BJY52DRAFT_1418696 [Lactarius psammicola]|nr:hypothetical protein BJY52DRAFT_1418696 [Lactarius psammicola]